MITSNVRTRIVILTDKREILLTEQQYQNILLTVQDGKTTDIIQIDDPDTGRTLFQGRASMIREFKESDYKEKSGVARENFEIGKEADKCLRSKATRNEWTQKMLSEISDEEVEHFRENARFNLAGAIEK